MDHFAHPRNVGKMDDADGVGEVGNANCGDIMKIYLKIEDDTITDVKFNTFGCGCRHRHQLHGHRAHQGQARSARRCSSPTMRWWKPWTACLPVKLHCSVLAEEAVKAALKDYYERQGLPVPPQCQQAEAHSCAACGACG